MSQDDPSKTEATQQPAPTSNQTTPKYQQIVVPEHAVKADTSGTSFLRTGTFPSLTDTTKQPPGFRESLELARLAGNHHLKTGGSWHHVDGNRIETTTGRKVEVIAGSYVAHRGPRNSPGPNFSATWATNSYTEVGSVDLPVGWTPPAAGSPPGSPAVAPAAMPVDPPTNFVESLSFPYSASFDRTYPDPSHPMQQDPNASADGTPSGSNSALRSGDVAAVTWAQRIMTYVGSASRPVPLVYAETRAGANHSYSYYSLESLTYVGSEGAPVPEVLAWTHAGSAETKLWAHAGDITTWNHALGPTSAVWQDTLAKFINTTQEAVTITVANTAANLFTLNTGIQEVINIAPAIGTLNLAFAIGAFNIGPNLTVNMPSSVTFTGDETGVKLASADMTAAQTRINAIHSNLASTLAAVSAVADHVSGNDTSLSMARLYLDTNLMLLNSMSLLGI